MTAEGTVGAPTCLSLDVQHERTLKKFEEILKAGSNWGTLQKLLPQGSDPEVESGFILATNLYKEKKFPRKEFAKQ
jgi:hypothetical protein